MAIPHRHKNPRCSKSLQLIKQFLRVGRYKTALITPQITDASSHHQRGSVTRGHMWQHGAGADPFGKACPRYQRARTMSSGRTQASSRVGVLGDLRALVITGVRRERGDHHQAARELRRDLVAPWLDAARAVLP